MDLRITPQTTVARSILATSQQTSRLGTLQNQASSGKKVLLPSDSPGTLGSILNSKAQDRQFDTYVANVLQGKSTLDQSVSTLQEAGLVLQTARTLAVEAAQSTNSDEAHQAIAQQIDRLLERLIGLSNTQQNGRYLYSGTTAQTQPFVVTATDSDGRPTQVTYQGGSQRDAVVVNYSQTVPTLYSGEEIFQYRERGATLYQGTTGAAAGSGTDSAIGIGTLLVRHTATTFAPGSGVQAGVSSAANDTLLGPAGVHQLTIVETSGTGAFGTVSLNGGPTVAFTSADTDLVLTGLQGEIIHLDTTAITANFNGTVSITAEGSLSVDGGASFVPIDFSGNQSIIDSTTGAVTNVNSTNIRRAGLTRLEYAGTSDVFETLMILRDDLRNTRGLPGAEQLASISRRIDEIDRARAGILNVVTDQSASLENLERLEFHLQDMQLTTKKWLSTLEDADLSQIVIDLQSQQNLLELTLGVTARVMSLSLLDFL